MTHERIAQVFDEWAVNGRAESMEHGHSDVVLQVLQRLRVRTGERALDLGCGNGWATRLLARAAVGASAVGIDCSSAMVARAQELTPLSVRARFEVARFEALPFPDASFERAFSMEALYYAVDLSRALREVRRVLRPGASFDFVIDQFAENRPSASWSGLVGLEMQRLDTRGWVASLEAAGFVEVAHERLRDSRGPGDPAQFVPNRHAPDWATQVELHEAGSLWLSARTPA